MVLSNPMKQINERVEPACTTLTISGHFDISLSLIVPPGLVLDSLHLMNISDMIPIHTTEHTSNPSPAHR